ncbi:GDYXXLXY domain-containing protein [Kangiella shandongensis]|uniref:GDYXXLXY domain-containing protein n=1 Tax=Kangiella shandongensis TaxID=2763258 RepID=UPI001CBDB8ED|nr:GDYXXLXY domain-containing protein [Kangiella shandongensis]
MKLTKPLVLILFIIQLAVPAYMIYEQRTVLSEGVVYKFKTRPIDPLDPFRGHYVTLRFEANTDPIATSEYLRKGDWVYAVLSEDKDGFAQISQLVLEEPQNKDFIKAEVSWGSLDRGYYVRLPFNRYYASEDTAPQIEKAVWRRQRDEVDNVYAEVSVLEGKATLKKLYVNELAIRDYLEQEVKNNNK